MEYHKTVRQSLERVHLTPDKIFKAVCCYWLALQDQAHVQTCHCRDCHHVLPTMDRHQRHPVLRAKNFRRTRPLFQRRLSARDRCCRYYHVSRKFGTHFTRANIYNPNRLRFQPSCTWTSLAENLCLSWEHWEWQVVT